MITAENHSYLPTYKQLLAVVRPRLVLEWGPGPNTDAALEVGARVVSIEQDAKWLHAHEVRLVQVYVDVNAAEYVCPPWFWNADLYFVDSRNRAKCINNIFRFAANPEHVLVLHDAQRTRYHSALKKYSFRVFPEPGTAVATKADKVFDTFMEIWPDAKRDSA